MVQKVGIGIALLSCVLILVGAGCGDTEMQTENNTLYTRYNLHYITQKGKNIGSYANFTNYPGHGFLPFNTQVEVKSWSRGYKITAVDSGEEILWDFKSKNMDNMRGTDYIDLIMSPEPVNYMGLTAEDQQGIQQGKAMQGMTKQGVMIALGYPAKHRTPSLEDNTWAYWNGRFGEPKLVRFDGSGKVVSINN